MNFDSLMGKVKQGVSAGAKKTEQVVNVSKLKMEVGNVNKEINSTYEKLGKAFFEMRNSDQPEEQILVSFCDELDALFLREKTIKHEIAVLEGAVVCPACSHANKKESTYCTNCGTKLPVPEPVAPAEPEVTVGLICSNCSTENTPDSLFCVNCGSKLGVVESEAPATEPPAAEAEPIDVVVSEAEDDAADENQSNA